MHYQIDTAIGHLLHKASYNGFTHLNAILKPHDLTPQLWLLLNRLWETDGLTQRELAELMYKDQTNLGRMIDKMEAQGLIKRTEHPQDRRAYHVSLTEKGARLKDILLPQVRDIQLRLLRGFTPEEIEVFRGMLQTYIKNASPPLSGEME
jgi:MarR family transcriptional regulator, organic hydroperoxide resistance regulator